MKRTIFIIFAALLLLPSLVQGQNTIGVSYGLGSSKVRAYPSYETKSIYGVSTLSVQWRNYTSELNLGCVGADIEYMQRGFAYAPYTSTNNNNEGNEDVELLYYYRYVNSIMVPLVWQPYAYMFHNRVRVFLDAAVTFSYNISSTYKNDLYYSYGYNDDLWQGDYEMRTERDNFWGYGLAAGGGVSYLHGRFEFHAAARYYLGYSDLIKNRNVYYANTTDNKAENPFSYTPIRSPIDNINIRVGISYRLTPDDFSAWYTKRMKSSGLRDGFGYDDQSGEDKNQKGGSNSKGNSNEKNSRKPNIGR